MLNENNTIKTACIFPRTGIDQIHVLFSYMIRLVLTFAIFLVKIRVKYV